MEEVEDWKNIIAAWPESAQTLYKILGTKEGIPNVLIPSNPESGNANVATDLRTVIWRLLLFHKSSALYSILPEFANTEEKQSQYYESLLQKSEDSKELKSIEKDLHRSAPRAEHKVLLTEDRREQLRRVLIAYSLHDPDLGYCQGLNFVAFMLILNLPEEEAFWGLIVLLNGLNLRDIYNPESDLLHVILSVIQDEITLRFPKLAHHFDEEGINVAMYAVDWITTFFVYSLTIETNTRVWDILLYNSNLSAVHAVDWLLKVSISIIHNLHDKLIIWDMEEIMSNIKLVVNDLSTKSLLSTALDFKLTAISKKKIKNLFTDNKKTKCSLM